MGHTHQIYCGTGVKGHGFDHCNNGEAPVFDLLPKHTVEPAQCVEPQAICHAWPLLLIIELLLLLTSQLSWPEAEATVTDALCSKDLHEHAFATNQLTQSRFQPA